MRVTTIQTTDNGTKEIVQETLSKVKIEKNSKGYNWEISLDFDRHDPTAVEKLFTEFKEYDTRLRLMFSQYEKQEVAK
jgi:hypothetical protein